MYISQLVVSCLWPQNYICPIRYENKYKIMNVKKEMSKDIKIITTCFGPKVFGFCHLLQNTKVQKTQRNKYLDFNMRNRDMAGVTDIFLKYMFCTLSEMLYHYVFVLPYVCDCQDKCECWVQTVAGASLPATQVVPFFLSPPIVLIHVTGLQASKLR